MAARAQQFIDDGPTLRTTGTKRSSQPLANPGRFGSGLGADPEQDLRDGEGEQLGIGEPGWAAGSSGLG